MQFLRKLTPLLIMALIIQLVFPVIVNHKSQVFAGVNGPVVNSTFPADNTTTTTLRPSIDVWFDESISISDPNKNIYVRKESTNTNVLSYKINSAQVRINGSHLNLSLNQDLELNTDYIIIVENDSVKTSAKNVPLIADYRWKFKTTATVDKTSPTISQVSYDTCVIDAATGLFTNVCTNTTSASNINASNLTIKLKFSEPVYLGTGNIELRNTSGSDTRTISVFSPEVKGAGSDTIAIKLDNPLLQNQTYRLTVKGGQNQANFKDVANNVLVGNYNTQFTTASSDEVLLESRQPNAITNVQLNQNNTLNLTLTFNQAVVPVANKNISIYDVSTNTQVGQLIPVRRTDNTTAATSFTYTINSRLMNNTEYYINIDHGSFVSASGVHLYRGITNTTIWKFKTIASVDNAAPQIITNGLIPANNAVNVARNEKIVMKFNEPVYANSGNILIKDYTTNIIYRSISVTSTRLTGAGTNTITIDPHSRVSNEAEKTYTSNKRYYVEIPSGAFKDASNNLYAGIVNNKNGFNFTVGETTNSKPLLQRVAPINGDDTVVAGTPQFNMVFDKALEINAYALTDAVIIPKQISGTVQPITLSASLSSDKKTVRLVPQANLVANTEYYINIPNDLIYDTNDNNYDGILNTYQWTIKTLGGDRVAPKIIRAESFSNKVRLVYDELLDPNSIPQIGNYYITINGATKNISSIGLEKNAVIFTLYDQISSGQQTLVAYTKPTLNPVRDLTGNAAESFVNQDAVYGQITTQPNITSSSYSGKTITLDFNEPLQKINSFAYLQFKVTANNVSNAVTSIRQNGTKIELGLTNSVPSNRAVVVNYTKGSYPLQGFNADVNSFNLTVGQGTGQGTTAPTDVPAVSSITVNSDTVSIVYNQAVESTPYASQYIVKADSLTRSVESVTLNSNTVLLKLSTPVQEGNVVTVSYSAAPIVLLSATGNGKYGQSYQNMTATAGTINTGAKVALQSVIAKGDTITLTFNKPLNTSSIPLVSQFYILAAGNNFAVRNVNVDNQSLVLKLNSSLGIGTEGTVTYYPNSGTPLKATDGDQVSSITSTKLTNQTTALDILSNEYSAIPTGVLLKESTAVKSTALSPSGQNVTFYSIENVKIGTAVDTLASGNMKDAEIRFEVPASEKAAMVAFPMASLQNALVKGGQFRFTVKYGDIYFEVPISSIDVPKAINLNNGNSYTNNLVIKIEKGNSIKTANLDSSIRSNSGTLIDGPYIFEATIVGPSNSSEIPLKGNLIRKVVVPQAISGSQATAVFYDEVAGNISGVPTTFTLNSGFTEITFMRPGTSAYAIISSNKNYNDISSHWARNTIINLTQKYIVEGHSATAFNPQKNITRGEFATYLVKGLGLSADKEAAKQFNDVNSASTLGGYIGAAVKAGIVSGVSSNQFKPNDNITRQDMAIMMMRVVNYTKMDVTLTSTPNSYLSPFTDGSKVSSYARTQVAQAIQIGIITGSTPTTINPLSNATRAEGVTMIERVLKKANYIQ